MRVEEPERRWMSVVVVGRGVVEEGSRGCQLEDETRQQAGREFGVGPVLFVPVCVFWEAAA